MRELSVVAGGRAFERARECIRATDRETLADMVHVARIAAPGGGEAARAAWLSSRLRDHGLQPRIDDVGNVIATSRATDGGARGIVMMAHLDTVFPADTLLDVRRNGTRLSGPGISDNARGLAGMLALARGLAAAEWPNRTPITFVGSVGEEGAGDLRGAKHYVRTHAGRIAAFIALDGAGSARVIHAGVGSRRLRVHWSGPGGHSWSDWGAPNAIHAASRAIARLIALPLPDRPRTTLTVGRIGGGTSVNTIPAASWFELDLRSESATALTELEAAVRAALLAAAREEGGAGSRLSCAVDLIGDRPAGATPIEEPLVQLALCATRAVGIEPELSSSSTDANVAMAATIAAIAIGAGGAAGGTHTTAEWYDNATGLLGLERALMIVLGVAGVTG
jgi:acetylornithine deacetylase/succinyl-diaminopimelate desuccinylase-like protein